MLGNKRRSRSSSIDPGHGRKEARSNCEQTSVRSHSPDIADDINREIQETTNRLAQRSQQDATMTVNSAVSMKNEDNTS